MVRAQVKDALPDVVTKDGVTPSRFEEVSSETRSKLDSHAHRLDRLSSHTASLETRLKALERK
jgi:hypothetical protein